MFLYGLIVFFLIIYTVLVRKMQLLCGNITKFMVFLSSSLRCHHDRMGILFDLRFRNLNSFKVDQTRRTSTRLGFVRTSANEL